MITDQEIPGNAMGVVTNRGPLALVGPAADAAAAGASFAEYRSRRAPQTRRRQEADLSVFAQYLNLVTDGNAPSGAELVTLPVSWRGITWGLVEGFARWQVLQGYAVGTVNVRLCTVKVFAQIAAKSGVITAGDLALILTVRGYSRKEGKRIDEQRATAPMGRRRGAKKPEACPITSEEARALKQQPDTPQGRRDALLLCLLLDHGLRAGEVAGLTRECLDLQAGELRFYRPKVDKVQIHRLTEDTLKAARAYVEVAAPANGPLFCRSWKGGRLGGAGLSARAISARVQLLGSGLGIANLSAHDLRHYWATQAARCGTPIDRLQDAGGWSSPAMALHYIAAAQIANDGVKLERTIAVQG